MTTYTFVPKSTAQFVDWNDPTIWSNGVVPNSPDADVIFPTVTQVSTGQPYVSFISVNNNFLVNSVSLQSNFLSINKQLSVVGDFAVLKDGEIDMAGSLSVATLENSGTDIQGQGQVNVSGTLNNITEIVGNGLTFTVAGLNNSGSLIASSGDLTMNVNAGGFANLSGSTLTGGTYSAGFANGSSVPSTLRLNVGGLIVVDAANVAIDGGGAILSFDSATQQYVPLQSSLQSIASSGTFSLSNQGFGSGTLTVDGKLSLGRDSSGPAKSTFSATQLIVDGSGQVSGIGTINAPIANAGAIIAGALSPPPPPTGITQNSLIINGAITGSGVLDVASAVINFGSSRPVGATLELNGPTSQNVVFLDNKGTLTLDNPSIFTGTIAPTGTGDEVILTGVALSSVSSYSYSGDSHGGTLTLQESGTTISLKFSGDFAKGNFFLSSGPQALSTSPPSLAITVNQDVSRNFVGVGDTDANGQADIAYANSGNLVVWLKTTDQFTETSVPNAHMGSEWSAYGTGDFNADGKTDVLWTNNSGQAAVWLLNGANLSGFGIPAGQMGAEWHVAGVGDFNGDKAADIFWVSNRGDPTVWEMSGPNLIGLTQPAGHMGTEWSVAATGDFNGDGTADLLWTSTGGDEALWTMSGGQLAGFNGALGQMGSEWHVAGAGDVNGDGTSDIVWVDTSNDVQVWQMSGGQIGQIVFPAGHDGAEWHLKAVGDFTDDGKADLLWLGGAGGAQIWQVNGTQVTVLQPTTPNTVFNF